MIGTVVSWNLDRGFGFVRDSEGFDYYVHIRQWPNRSKRPIVGQRVEWDVEPSRIEGRSPQAVNIRLLTVAPNTLAVLSGGQR